MPRSESAPRWRPARAVWPRPPAAVRAWLGSGGSLTRILRRRCPGGFSVALLGLDWRAARPDERRHLGLRGARVLERRVFLRCGGEPWVFARTVIPPQTLAGPGRRLYRLGGRSLGEVLFSHPFVVRGAVEWAPVPAVRLGLPPAWGELWGRRIHYLFHGRPLLVSEFFLPALWAGGRADEPCPCPSPASESATTCA